MTATEAAGEIDGSVEELCSLVSTFSAGLYTVFRTWRWPLRDISVQLMEGIVAASNPTLQSQASRYEEHVLTAALFVLPGLIGETRRQRLKVPALFHRLGQTTSPLLTARAVLREARALQQRVRDGQAAVRADQSGRGPLDERAILKRLESLVRDGRLSAACSELDNLQDRLSGIDMGLRQGLSLGGSAKIHRRAQPTGGRA